MLILSRKENQSVAVKSKVDGAAVELLVTVLSLEDNRVELQLCSATEMVVILSVSQSVAFKKVNGAAAEFRATVVSIGKNRVDLGFDAPIEISITRAEVSRRRMKGRAA